jgi:hypothetical protein
MSQSSPLRGALQSLRDKPDELIDMLIRLPDKNQKHTIGGMCRMLRNNYENADVGRPIWAFLAACLGHRRLLFYQSAGAENHPDYRYTKHHISPSMPLFPQLGPYQPPRGAASLGGFLPERHPSRESRFAEDYLAASSCSRLRTTCSSVNQNCQPTG